MAGVAIIADSKSEGFNFAKGVYEYVKKLIKDCVLIDITKSNFKDGEFKIRISENIRRKKCFFIHDSNKEPSLWLTELVFTLEALKSSSPEEINLVLPYTRFSRQERKDESRISVNIKAIADIVSFYADRGLTCDLHASQIQEYFSKPFDNLYSFPSLIKYLKEERPELLKDLVIVSPDLGGGKRVEWLAKRLAKEGIMADIAFGHKTREKDNQIAKMTIIGNVEGKNCLVVDDIIDTGGTMVKAGEILRQNGAKKIYAYGTHALLTDGVEKFKVFDKLLVSDTLKTEKQKHIGVVSLVDLFGEAIYRTVAGESLSILFS